VYRCLPQDTAVPTCLRVLCCGPCYKVKTVIKVVAAKSGARSAITAG